MKVGDSVRYALDSCDRGEMDHAMLHACIAVDGTARRVYQKAGEKKVGNKDRFTRMLRDNYAILGPMGAPGIDLGRQRFPVHVKEPTAPGGQPDIADVIYVFHRCFHSHGEELPSGFELLGNASGPDRHTGLFLGPGRVQLSDRMIFALLGVAVLSPVNTDQRVPDTHYLTYGAGIRMPINEWWGRAADFIRDIVPTDPPPAPFAIDVADWMEAK